MDKNLNDPVEWMDKDVYLYEKFRLAAGDPEKIKKSFMDLLVDLKNQKRVIQILSRMTFASAEINCGKTKKRCWDYFLIF